MPLPANNTIAVESPLIAGSVLPIQRAEELLATLPGVISARIVAGPTGAVAEIHILTTTDVTPKQTVRNVESALIAHLGMRVSHKKISVAMSDDSRGSYRTATMPVDVSPRTALSNGNFAKHSFATSQPSISAFAPMSSSSTPPVAQTTHGSSPHPPRCSRRVCQSWAEHGAGSTSRMWKFVVRAPRVSRVE